MTFRQHTVKLKIKEMDKRKIELNVDFLKIAVLITFLRFTNKL